MSSYFEFMKSNEIHIFGKIESNSLSCTEASYVDMKEG